MLRLAPSFLRLGSWEVFKPTDPHTGVFIGLVRGVCPPLALSILRSAMHISTSIMRTYRDHRVSVRGTGRAGPSARAEHIPVSRKLLDFTIRNYFPEIWQQASHTYPVLCVAYNTSFRRCSLIGEVPAIVG